MTPRNSARRRKSSIEESNRRWAALVDDDTAGIDADIEKLGQALGAIDIAGSEPGASIVIPKVCWCSPTMVRSRIV